MNKLQECEFTQEAIGHTRSPKYGAESAFHQLDVDISKSINQKEDEDMMQKITKGLYSSLHEIVIRTDIDELRKVDFTKVDVNEKSEKGNTPLVLAVHNYTMCEILLKNGADPNIKDKFSETALHYVAKFGDPDTVKLLIQYGANVNEQSVYDATPLMYAVDWRKIYMARVFLEHGADVTINDFRGDTVFDCVERIPSNDEMKTLLREYEPKQEKENNMSIQPTKQTDERNQNYEDIIGKVTEKYFSEPPTKSPLAGHKNAIEIWVKNLEESIVDNAEHIKELEKVIKPFMSDSENTEKDYPCAELCCAENLSPFARQLRNLSSNIYSNNRSINEISTRLDFSELLENPDSQSFYPSPANSIMRLLEQVLVASHQNTDLVKELLAGLSPMMVNSELIQDEQVPDDEVPVSKLTRYLRESTLNMLNNNRLISRIRANLDV